MLLSIITLTVAGREASLERLRTEISKQIGQRPFVEHLVVPGSGSYGMKMRSSLEMANGHHVCWIDDDDFVSCDYVSSIVGAISDHDPDVVTFGSDMVGYRRMWFHANVQDRCREYDGAQVWTANHYCAWRRSIALTSTWLPRNYGSETAWYKLLSLAYPKLREHHIHKMLHLYYYNPETTLCQDKVSIEKSLKDDCDEVVFVQLFQPCGPYKFGTAVGRFQPMKGFYFVTLPDYSMVKVHHNDLLVLGRFRFE